MTGRGGGESVGCKEAAAAAVEKKKGKQGKRRNEARVREEAAQCIGMVSRAVSYPSAEYKRF